MIFHKYLIKMFLLMMIVFGISTFVFAEDVVTLFSGKKYRGVITEKSDTGIVLNDHGIVYPLIYEDIEYIKEDWKDNTGLTEEQSRLLDAFFEKNAVLEQINFVFAQRNTEKIDYLINEYHKTNARFPSGERVVDFLYKRFDSIRGNVAQYEHFIKEFGKYKQKNPDSFVIRVLLIEMYKTLAWEYRGGDYINKVSGTNLGYFKENLEKALEMGLEAETIENLDPYLYKTLIFVVAGLGMSKDSLYELVHKAVALDRDYFEIYLELANAIMPRWGGQVGEVEEFADLISAKRNDEIVYALMAHKVREYVREVSFKKFNFEWPRVKKGMEQYLEKYPQSLYHRHVFALMACQYKDKEVAEKMFNEIGHLWLPETSHFWKNVAVFYQWRNWALFDGEYPGFSEIFTLIERGDLQSVDSLLNDGVDINQKNRDGMTPLQFAIFHEESEIANLLIELDADLTLRNKFGNEVIHMVADNGQLVVLKNLIKHGADVNVKSDEYLWTPLYFAIRSGHKHIVSYLIRVEGVDLNARDDYQRTPLHILAFNNQLDLAERILKQEGVLINAKDTGRRTPLYIAMENGHEKMVNLLKAEGGVTYDDVLSAKGFKKAYEYMLKGDDLYEKKEYGNARWYYERASLLSPKTPDNYYKMGLTYLVQDKCDVAVEQAQKALQYKSDYTKATDLIEQCSGR